MEMFLQLRSAFIDHVGRQEDGDAIGEGGREERHLVFLKDVHDDAFSHSWCAGRDDDTHRHGGRPVEAEELDESKIGVGALA